MIKHSFILCIISAASSIVSGQIETRHSIAEINKLLLLAKSDTDRINLQLEAALDYISIKESQKQDDDSAFFYADAASKIASELNLPEYRAKCWCIYSNLFRHTGDTTRGRAYISEALALLTKYDLRAGLGDAYIELGGYYNAFSENQVAQKITCYQKAERLYEETNQKEKQATTLKHIADFHQLQYQDSIALGELERALSIYHSINYPNIQGVYDLMGYILYNASNYKQALKYCLLAVQTAQKVNCAGQELSTIYNRAGLVYYQLLQYDDALKYFRQSFEISYADKDTASMLIISPNIINSYLRLQRPNELLLYLGSVRSIYESGSTGSRVYFASSMVQAHLLANQPGQAAPYADQLKLLASNSNNDGIQRALFRAIIPYYLAIHKYAETYPYLISNGNICRKRNILSGLSDNYLWWYKADSALHNYSSAIEHYKLYKAASDSALQIANNKQIEQLLVEYETAKKDQTIALKQKDIQLLTSQSKLQQAQLKESKLIRNITFASIAMLVLIIGLLYNRYSLKQRGNKQLREQQRQINQKNEILQEMVHEKNDLLEEKEWLVKEIHHRVKNNLQIVISLLNTQSKYLDNKEAVQAISESRHRMQAMSLIHQKLYQSDNTTSVNMQTYISELTDYLKTSFDNGRPINFKTEVDSIELDLAQAIPLGLILNELITNSIKYAFMDGQAGSIQIKMIRLQQERVLLEIRDNGVGLPGEIDFSKSSSMGMRLVAGLARQINAQLTIDGKDGVCVQLKFDVDTDLTSLKKQRSEDKAVRV